MRKATTSVTMSVCPSARNNSALTEQIFTKFDIWIFSENTQRKPRFHYNTPRITGILLEDLCIFTTVSPWILFRIKCDLDKFVEKIKTYILCLITFFFRKSYRLCDNVEKYGRVRQTTDDNIKGSWALNAGYLRLQTDRQTQYVIFIDFPRQQWLRERASMFRYSSLPILYYTHVL